MHAAGATARVCPQCDEPISPVSPEGLCPACVLMSAATVSDEGPADALPPFPRLSNYEIIEVIGQGGMGIVYKARQKSPARIVAVKVMRGGLLADEKDLRRFRLEAQAAAQLVHRNIVTIYEVGQEEGLDFFSMEYVEGKSLAEILGEKKLSAEQTAQLIKKVAEAVNYAHERRILHRDLKPANIVVDPKGEPRITDFGLAQQLEVPSDVTKSGTILGTPSYMPPEQAQGRVRDIGVGSDVYSIGAVLYEAITFRPPFRADSLLETLRQVVETPPAAPRLLNAKVPRDLEVICLKCLRKEASQRYASAEALAEDLERFLKGEPIEARPIGIIERNITWCLRNRAAAGGLMTAALLLILLAIAALLSRANSLQDSATLARWSSKIITNHLNVLSRPIATLAADSQFQDQVRERRTNDLRTTLERMHERLGKDPLFQQTFANLLLLLPNGDRLVRVPENEDFIPNRAIRDYFQGATNLFRRDTTPVYYSKVFQSTDDGFFKIAMAVPVAASAHSDELAGVLCQMIKTDSTEGALGINDERQKAVVFGRWDDSDRGSLGRPTWVIWLHPKFRSGAQPIPLTRDFNFEGRDRFFFYLDPAARVYEDFPWPWLAGFAEVPNTPFVVLVQSRDWVGFSFLITMLSCFVAGALLAGTRWLRKRRQLQIPM